MNGRYPNIFCLPTALFCSEVIDYDIRLLKKNGRRSSLNGFLNCFLVLENGVNRKGQLFLVGSSKCLRLGTLCRAWVKLLLMGEPYEGLAPVIVEEIEKTLHSIRSEGITTISVTQNAVAALKLADKSVILDTGEIFFQGTAQEVPENEQLRPDCLVI